MAMLVQWLSARLGVVTGKSLPEVCRERFSPTASKLLWLQAEVIAMACDLAEVVGAAIALEMLFGIPLFAGGLIAGVVATGLLEMERRGHRRFEVVVVGMLVAILLGFLYSALRAGGDIGAAVRGFNPHFEGAGSVTLAVGILGATVMPHVIYLHSALSARRATPDDVVRTRALLRATRTDVIVALTAAGLVNVVMLWVAATLLHGLPGNPGESLQGAHDAYRAVAGSGTALAFALALLISGFASSSVGTFSGQIAMEGFTGRRIPVLLRRAITLAPALVVLGLGLNATDALIISQVILSFGIPFALIPLVRFTADRELMRGMISRRTTTFIAVLVATAIVLLNGVLLVSLATGA
jgi:manganese transport protein